MQQPPKKGLEKPKNGEDGDPEFIKRAVAFYRRANEWAPLDDHCDEALAARMRDMMFGFAVYDYEARCQQPQIGVNWRAFVIAARSMLIEVWKATDSACKGPRALRNLDAALEKLLNGHPHPMLSNPIGDIAATETSLHDAIKAFSCMVLDQFEAEQAQGLDCLSQRKAARLIAATLSRAGYRGKGDKPPTHETVRQWLKDLRRLDRPAQQNWRDNVGIIRASIHAEGKSARQLLAEMERLVREEWGA